MFCYTHSLLTYKTRIKNMIKSNLHNDCKLKDKQKQSEKQIRQVTHKILFIGVNGIEASQCFAEERYNCITLFSNKQASDWLAEQALFIRLELETPILAIISDVAWLKADNFSLLKNIQSLEGLNEIPIIAISEKKCTKEERSQWLKKGIDDCYDIPIDWQKLHTRIIFLREIKAIQQKKNTTKLVVFDEKGLQLPRSKRILDIAVSISGLIIFSPILLVIALLIKLESKGAIIYASKRAGTAYQIFNFYKFRTMYANADKHLANLKHLNQYNFTDEKSKNTFVKIQNDPRVTKIGRFLRMTSLDELPQLINVLKGDMSLVGNRPLPLYEAQQLTCDGWARRFLAPAGITGLWQVSKRGKKEMSVSERIALDVEYAQNYSFWNDLKIIFQTIPAMLQKETV